jgi:hypothetical protein
MKRDHGRLLSREEVNSFPSESGLVSHY